MFRYVIVLLGMSLYVKANSGVNFLLTDDEKKAFMVHAQPVVDKCLQEFKMTKEDLIKAHSSKDMDSIDSCFIACCLKGHQLLDDKGMFTNEEAFKVIDKVVKNDDARNAIKKIGETCLEVNEKEVSDGDKGCERAKLLIQCFKEHKRSD